MIYLAIQAREVAKDNPELLAQIALQQGDIVTIAQSDHSQVDHELIALLQKDQSKLSDWSVSTELACVKEIAISHSRGRYEEAAKLDPKNALALWNYAIARLNSLEPKATEPLPELAGGV